MSNSLLKNPKVDIPIHLLVFGSGAASGRARERSHPARVGAVLRRAQPGPAVSTGGFSRNGVEHNWPSGGNLGLRTPVRILRPGKYEQEGVKPRKSRPPEGPFMKRVSIKLVLVLR